MPICILEGLNSVCVCVCVSLTDTSIHDDFRLFLSSMPTKVFPVTVLQNSVKVTHTHTLHMQHLYSPPLSARAVSGL